MDLLKYNSMNNASNFDMKTKVRHLPTTELMVFTSLFSISIAIACRKNIW